MSVVQLWLCMNTLSEFWVYFCVNFTVPIIGFENGTYMFVESDIPYSLCALLNESVVLDEGRTITIAFSVAEGTATSKCIENLHFILSISGMSTIFPLQFVWFWCIAPEDFIITHEEAVFTREDVHHCINITAIIDSIDEGPENFTVMLELVEGDAHLEPDQVSITITNLGETAL